MADFYIKQGDRLPVLRSTLTTSDGAAINLTAATVNFLYQDTTTTPQPAAVVGTGTVTIIDADDGIVEYAWAAADTATVAEYNAEWEVQIGGLRMTVPNNGYIVFEVQADLEDA
jgi:hypothetical protein